MERRGNWEVYSTNVQHAKSTAAVYFCALESIGDIPGALETVCNDEAVTPRDIAVLAGLLIEKVGAK
jgi:hypothetical protein